MKMYLVTAWFCMWEPGPQLEGRRRIFASYEEAEQAVYDLNRTRDPRNEGPRYGVTEASPEELLSEYGSDVRQEYLSLLGKGGGDMAMLAGEISRLDGEIRFLRERLAREQARRLARAHVQGGGVFLRPAD